MCVCVCLGDDFDIREFHDEILRLGPVPLHVAELAVYQWIRSQVGHASDTVAISNCLISAALLFFWASVRLFV